MPASDTQHGKKAPPRAGPKRKPILQVGPVVAKTQRRFEQANPRARQQPKVKTPRPTPPPRPTQIAHQQETQYKSQAGAVRRAAATQRVLGPGHAVRPRGHGQVLTSRRIVSAKRDLATKAIEQGYKSQGQAVAKESKRQKDEAKARQGGTGIPVAAVHAPVAAAGLFAKAGGLIGQGAAAYAKPIISAVKENDMGGMEIIPSAVKTVGHAGKDVYGAATGIVPSAIKEASDVYHETKKKGPVKGAEKLGKDLADPYVQFFKHPGKTLTEHPVTTPLMFAPAARVPGRFAGRVARVAGKQTLRRGEAALPGTTVTETRAGSRDYFVNRAQRRRDRKRGGVKPVTQAEVHRQVDEHFDLEQHRAQDAAAHAHRKAKRDARAQGATRAEAEQAGKDAAELAREHEHEQARVRFAQRFGANERPSTSAAEVEFTHGNRMSAWMRLEGARARRRAADLGAKAAIVNAKTARLKVKTTSRLDALRSQRTAAQRALTAEQRAAERARRNHEKAQADARVSAATRPTTPRMKELQRQRDATLKQEPSWGVTVVRKQVSDADKRVNQITKQLQREEEKASRLEGVTQGRQRAGKMTKQAGRAVADQREKVGRLHDALGEAKGEAARLRQHLKETEGAHRSRVGKQVQSIDRQLAAEHARVRGVAPGEHEALLNAIDEHAAAPHRVRAARDRVKGIDEQIAAEQKRISGVPPAEHDALLKALEERDAARADYEGVAARHTTARQLAIDTKIAHRNAALVSPAGQGRLFSHESDAVKVMNRLNEQGHTIESGATSPVHLRTKEPGTEGKTVTLHGGRSERPHEFTVKQVGEHFGVFPKTAWERMYGSNEPGAKLPHSKVGASPHTVAKAMRRSRGLLTQSVLPISPRWLGGQAGEGAVRALLTGAGPFDRARFGRIVKQMNEDKPGSGDDFARRVIGGQWSATSGIGHQVLGEHEPLAETFAGAAAPVRVGAQAATWAGGLPPLKLARKGWRGYTGLVFNHVNGFIERNTRKAMAGQHIRKELLDHRMLNLTDKAIQQAADGLKNTAEQQRAGRAVDDMYGQYAKHSPEMRSALMHWTPFFPWFRNAVHFLTRVLPRDHPVTTSLILSLNAAQEDWRKANGLAPGEKGAKPDFLLGGFPVKGGGTLPLSHYTPFGVGNDIPGSLADMVLPQALDAIGNLKGVDWKGQRLKEPGVRGREFTKPERVLKAGTSIAEAQIPLVGLLGNTVTGVIPRYVDRKGKYTPGLGERVGKLNPARPIYPPTKPKKKTKSQPFGGGGLSSGFDSGSGFGGGGF